MLLRLWRRSKTVGAGHNNANHLPFNVTGLGFILIISGGATLTRIIKEKLGPNVFNTDNETFPQEERLIQNAYSINLPVQYQLKGKTRPSWINYINPRRSLLIMGSPGSTAPSSPYTPLVYIPMPKYIQIEQSQIPRLLSSTAPGSGVFRAVPQLPSLVRP